jgi:sortase A
VDQARRYSRGLTRVGVHPHGPLALSCLHRAAPIAARCFFTAGFLALGYTAYVAVDAQAYQKRAQARFETARHETATVASPAPIDGDSIGELRIPRLGLSTMIVQGDSPANLQRAVGHLADSALPGKDGNVVLAGHRDTFFRPLQQVRAGDSIIVRSRTADYEYLVDSLAVVAADAVEVLEPTGGRALTLITCFPFIYVGPAPERFIVRAHQISAREKVGP